ncbi:MAG: DNA repair protein RecN [Clostridium sp.]|nr:DNA repair protein RecN [Clostridium sp.]MCM1399419.1 DNA repair protein RecN [Clostridium sp.]MCM1459973.1 DNA repair protein RecN [Bacteroides sp.]
MLLNMHIKNIVLIDDIDISFDDNLNILTGETGAGKSIIIGSLGICLGGKFQKELLRDDTMDGMVELTFSIDRTEIKKQLEKMEVYPDENDELLIARRLNKNGRAINRINDNTVTTAKLKEVAGVLIDLHAQHEQQTLLKPSMHLEILDRFGGDDIAKGKDCVRDLYDRYIKLKKDMEAMSMDENEKNRQMDFLKYEINEISTAKLVAGEDEELEAAYKKAVNAKEILSTASEIYDATGYGTKASAADLIGRALGQIKQLSSLDADLDSLCSSLIDIDSMLNDFNRELSDYMQSMEFDDAQFASIESRLDVINSLKAKYGRTMEEIAFSLEKFEAEYDKLVLYDEQMEKLNHEIKKLESELAAACDRLTTVRKHTAKKLCSMIKDALVELNFMSVEFDMSFTKLDKFTQNGNDQAYFMISTNVGEKVRPLFEVASGGELSRVMLALKSCIAYEDDTPTLIFDEIDVGISGKTAQSVAKKLSIIGRQHQVICITHLPQIASMADSHFIIEKKVENNKTTTNIRKLDEKSQIDEISRLLGGEEVTEATLTNAREMKDLANKTKIN